MLFVGAPRLGNACQLAIGTAVAWFCFASDLAEKPKKEKLAAVSGLSAVLEACFPTTVRKAAGRTYKFAASRVHIAEYMEAMLTVGVFAVERFCPDNQETESQQTLRFFSGFVD